MDEDRGGEEMTPTQAMEYQSKTIRKLTDEVNHQKRKYEALKDMSVNSLMAMNEMLYELRKENSLLRKILAG